MRALVVDDSRAIRRLIGRTVTELGFECFEAGRGQEALDRLAEVGRVDLILLDWGLPEMNGLAVLAAVRANPAWNEIVLLMVISAAEVSEMPLALDAGANDFLVKPFTSDVLREKLQFVGLVTA